MRLTCTNCGAQYEVPDDVIPPAGRDVQCSACGHTFYAMPDGTSAPPPSAAPVDEPDEEPDEDHLIPDPDAPHPGTPEADPDAPHPDPGQPEPATGPAARRKLDPSVASVLREERDTSEALKRGGDGATAAGAAAAAGSAIARARPGQPRSSQLPDVDEINSTLTPEGEKPRRGTEQRRTQQRARARRNGFRLGFGLIWLIALAAWLAYWQAPRIAAALPAAESALTAYVSQVDGARSWLDIRLQGLLGSPETAAGEG